MIFEIHKRYLVNNHEYDLPESSIRYFTKEEIKTILRGKVIRIFGDSHSRNMFNTLMFMLTGDYISGGFMLPYAISNCRGGYDIYTQNIPCRKSAVGLDWQVNIYIDTFIAFNLSDVSGPL